MAVGQTSAGGGGGGEVDIVYGVLADGEGVQVTSNSTIITLPSNIKKLTGLNLVYTHLGEFSLLCYPAGGSPRNPTPNEARVWRITYMGDGMIAGGWSEVTVSGNKATIDYNIDAESISGVAYTYIPE